MAGAAAGARVTGAGPPALVVGDSVLEIRFFSVSGAGRKRTVSIADLDEVPEHVVWLISVRLISMVTLKCRHWPQLHREIPAVGQGKRPCPVSALRSGIGTSAKDPGSGPWRPSRSDHFREASRRVRGTTPDRAGRTRGPRRDAQPSRAALPAGAPGLPTAAGELLLARCRNRRVALRRE